MYAQAETIRPTSWDQIAQPLLRAMEQFDDNVASGLANMGDLQNGKGDFFNDLLALILETATGAELGSRRKVPGLIFPENNLDIAYPPSGHIRFLIEAKAVGTPKHPGNPTSLPFGRGGSADIDKRIKELSFKAIDLKAEYARQQSLAGLTPGSVAGPTGNLTTWLRSVPPLVFLFIMGRVIDDRDHAALVRSADRASKVMDGVGLYCFEPRSATEPTRYVERAVPDHLELSRVLFAAAQDLTAMAATQP